MKMEELTYILTEVQTFEGISSPLKTTNRIKYSCFAASCNYLVFGATSGGLYIFKKDTCTFLYLIPNKEGAVTHVVVSPDEKWFGFATVKGLSCVLEHTIGSVSRRIISTEHEGVKVTSIQWNPLSSQLYVGDELGRISVINNSSFLAPTVTLMQLDSQIVQLDCCSHLLLASTFTRCYLCDTYREQYRQIGSRARDGPFGGCFFSVSSVNNSTPSNSEAGYESGSINRPYNPILDSKALLADESLRNIKLFCTRPGLRLWEVHVDGTVMNTHQFKRLLDTAPTGVIRSPPSEIPLLPGSSGKDLSTLAFNFSTLHRLSSKFLLTFHSNGIYILDPTSGHIVLWTDAFRGIIDVCAVGQSIYIWMGDFHLHSVNLTQLDQFLVQLYLQKRYSFCANICASYVDALSRQVPSSYKLRVLTDLLDKLKENHVSLDDSVYGKVSDLLTKISSYAQGQHCAQILDSGIFIVGNAHLLSQKEEMDLRSSIKHGTTLINRNDFQKTNVSLCDEKENDNRGNSYSMKTPALCADNVHPFFEPSDSMEKSSDDDYDPFVDLPFSALTSPETVAAFKQLSSTVSETISNGTKSLKEKWHLIEEKIRAPESPQSGLEKNLSENEKASRLSVIDESQQIESSLFSKSNLRKSVNLPAIDVSKLENICKQLSGSTSGGVESHLQQLYVEFLEALAILFVTYRNFTWSSDSENSLNNLLLEEENSAIGIRNLFQSTCSFTFPFRDYFNKDMMLELEQHFLHCLKSGLVVAWLQMFLPSNIPGLINYPPFLHTMFSEQDFILDQVLGKVLQFSKVLLNPYTILECLENSMAPCQYFSWNVVIDSFNNGPSSNSAGTDSKNWPLPCLLNAMLVMLQLGQTESCRNLGIHVEVKYILRLMLRLDGEVCKIYAMFLSFLDKLPTIRLQTELCVMEVLCFTKLAFEELSERSDESQCECGFPLKNISSSVTFNRVSFALLAHLWKCHDKSAAFKLCHSYGLWSQLLSIRHDEALQEVLPLLLQTGCIVELKHWHGELSDSLWLQIFKLLENLQDGFCLGCTKKFSINETLHTVPWSAVATLLIQETSSPYALKLISRFSHAIPRGNIDFRFYQSCLIATVADKHSEGLGKPLLDMFMYPSELPCMSPELAEKIGSKAINPLYCRNHHWGLRLKLSESSCMCCLLPLNSPSLLEGWGITGFKCGHSFHSVCLVKSHIRNCPICNK